jgi:anti-sigma B factor antagonist
MVQEDGQSPSEGCREEPELPQHRHQAQQAPPREQLMAVAVRDRPDAVILAVRGDVDGLTAPRLHDAISDAFDRLDGRVLVVDLSEVGFLGSPGLHTLTTSARDAVEQRGYKPLRIVVDSSRPVVRPIERSGLDGFLELYHDVADALRDR